VAERSWDVPIVGGEDFDAGPIGAAVLEERRHRLDQGDVVSSHEPAYAAHEAVYPSVVPGNGVSVDPLMRPVGSELVQAIATPGSDGDCRLDVLVHAAAQLPDGVRLELPASGAERKRILDLAAAYGLGERVDVEGKAQPQPRAILVHVATPVHARQARDPSLGWRVEGGAGGGAREVSTIAELIDAVGVDYSDAAPIARAGDDGLAAQRVVVLTNVPNHYRVPLWNALARRLRAAGAELRILFSASAAERPWVRHEEIVFDHRFLRTGLTGFPVDLERQLRDFRPTLVVSGGFSPLTTGRALRFAAARGVPFCIWSGDTHRQAARRGRTRRLERRWIANRSTCALAYSWLAAEYLRDLAPELPVVIGRNSAPITHEAAEGSGGESVEFLTVGRAIPGKRLDVAIDAVRLLDPDLPCRLTVCGDGPELTALVAKAQGDERIRFLGAVESDQILGCYREADAFLFSSDVDVFGLVLVEALGSGVATIAGAVSGGAADLAVHERNCLLVPNHDPAAWAEAIRRLTADAPLRRRLAARGRKTIFGRWTIQHSVDAWIAGFRLALRSAR
jgi:glycosyltransferase involved in cell wall biosynthesis